MKSKAFPEMSGVKAVGRGDGGVWRLEDATGRLRGTMEVSDERDRETSRETRGILDESGVGASEVDRLPDMMIDGCDENGQCLGLLDNVFWMNTGR